MKPTPFQIIVVLLLTIICIQLYMNRNVGRYVNFGSDSMVTILDTKTGVIHSSKGDLNVVDKED